MYEMWWMSVCMYVCVPVYACADLPQYCYLQCFPMVVERRTQIQACIVSYLDRVIPLLSQANAVIDLGLRLETDGSFSAEVIELNPWFADTSACLFSWSRDRDLIDGKLPLEFRIVSEPVANPLDGIAPCWLDYRRSVRGREDQGRPVASTTPAIGWPSACVMS